MKSPFDPARQTEADIVTLSPSEDNGRTHDRREPSDPGAHFEPVAEAIPGNVSPITAAVLSADSPVSEEFRILRTRVRRIDKERPFRCVGVVSSVSGEGKTTISLGLAAALAREPGCRVLLIEADVRRPAIGDRLGLGPAAGLSEWLHASPTAAAPSSRKEIGALLSALGKGPQAKEDPIPVRVIMPHRFSLFSAGLAGLDHHELLASARMARLIETARQNFDFTIVDCPPLLPVADSVMLQDMVDGFLLVVRARHTPKSTIRRALSRLKGETIQGMVFNGQREFLRNSSYGQAYKPYAQ
jgi:succinoglycan biosynthesis transport protein ExoP